MQYRVIVWWVPQGSTGMTLEQKINGEEGELISHTVMGGMVEENGEKVFGHIHWLVLGHGLPTAHERLTNHLAKSLLEFGNIPEGKEIPANAVTLWKAMIHGFDRVADALTKPPEK